MKHTFSFFLYFCSFLSLLSFSSLLSLSHSSPLSSSMTWSDGDNGRLIITMKLSWFSAPLGAVGRAAAASEIVPSSSPLIIRKHEFSRAGNLPVPSQTTVGSCTACVHAYVWVNVWEREKVRERRQKVKGEYIFCICVCVCLCLPNVRACLWVRVWERVCCFCFLSRC